MTASQKIPLIKPYITEDVKQAVMDVLDSGYLTEGPVTRQLEERVKKYTGCENALAVTSCTTGLDTALRAVGIGRGDEVIVPDYTYPATASAVALVGAVPVIVDVDPETMLISYEAVEAAVTSNTKAIIPVSLFGNPLDYNVLNKLKEKYNLVVIEDAACSIGAEFNGVKAGKLADISVFSMHPRKFITTGEGGMITTDNAHWAEWMNEFKHFGMKSQDGRLGTRFDMIGTNYKLSNVLAAIGVAQMNVIDELLDKRRKLAENYTDILNDLPDVKLPAVHPGARHSYQSFCVFVNNRNTIMDDMRAKGVEVQVGTYSLHMHKAFSDNSLCRIEGEMKGSRFAFDHCLTLPMYHDMTADEQSVVVEMLKDELKRR